MTKFDENFDYYSFRRIIREIVTKRQEQVGILRNFRRMNISVYTRKTLSALNFRKEVS